MTNSNFILMFPVYVIARIDGTPDGTLIQAQYQDTGARGIVVLTEELYVEQFQAACPDKTKIHKLETMEALQSVASVVQSRYGITHLCFDPHARVGSQTGAHWLPIDELKNGIPS